MSVKCTTCDKSCSFRKEPFSPDYTALETRHNALVEAVAWHLECDACPLKNTTEVEKHGFAAIWKTRRAARAEVDRLLLEESK